MRATVHSKFLKFLKKHLIIESTRTESTVIEKKILFNYTL